MVKRSLLKTPWWGTQRHRGGARRVASRGGTQDWRRSLFNFIPSAAVAWVLPKNRRRKGRRHTTKWF